MTRSGVCAVTLQQVRAYLDADEPAYQEAARLGVDALPHLETLVESPDTLLAAKAAYLAGLIDGARSLPVLTRAARSADRLVRSAAAATAAHLPPETAASVLVSSSATPTPRCAGSRSIPFPRTSHRRCAARSKESPATTPTPRFDSVRPKSSPDVDNRDRNRD